MLTRTFATAELGAGEIKLVPGWNSGRIAWRSVGGDEGEVDVELADAESAGGMACPLKSTSSMSSVCVAGDGGGIVARVVFEFT